MLAIKRDALLQVSNSVLVIANFEVGKTQIVVQLCVVHVSHFSFLKCLDRSDVVLLLVHRDSIVEVSMERTDVILLKVRGTDNCQTFPVLALEHVLAHLDESYFFFRVELALRAHLAIFFVVLVIVAAVFKA